MGLHTSVGTPDKHINIEVECLKYKQGLALARGTEVSIRICEQLNRNPQARIQHGNATWHLFMGGLTCKKFELIVQNKTSRVARKWIHRWTGL